MHNDCTWPANDLLMRKYHDEEWGIPLHDDRKLFEYLLLDTFQAGLSWKTILYKRENFRSAFDDFDFEKIALYDEEKINTLLNDAGIIRNRAKIRAAISNAKAFLRIRETFGTFDNYIWQFTNFHTIVHYFHSSSQIPTNTPESDAMSRDLFRRGFRFVGTTICYAFMQAAGMVNDHLVGCSKRNL